MNANYVLIHQLYKYNYPPTPLNDWIAHKCSQSYHKLKRIH